MTYTAQQIRKMTDQEVYDALTKDFLERDGDTFVRIRRTDRLGWEETLPKGSAYSERMLSPGSTEELLKKAYSHACDMIKAMNTPYQVSVNVSGDKSFTNSKTVFVASDMLDDKTMTIGERLDVFTGYAVHEGSHLLYTDWEHCRKNPPKSKIIRFLRNILEDEMIEIRLGEEKPGLANFITAAKYHAFGRYLDTKKDVTRTDNDRITEIVNSFLSLVRYPKALTPDTVHRHGRLLLEMREVLNPYPADTKQVAEAADRIHEILVREYQNEMNQQEQQGGQNQQCGQSPQNNKAESGNGRQEEQPQNGDGSEPNKQKQESPDSQGDNRKLDDSDNNDATQNGQTSESGTDEEKDGRPSVSRDDAIRQLEGDFEKIRKDVEKLASEPKTDIDDREIAKGFKENNRILALECEGKLERGKTKDSLLFKAEPNPGAYNSSLNRIRRFIPAVSRILKCNGTEYKTTLRGVRSGFMDPCKIAEAYQGVPSVYMRDSEVKADRMTVALLIDESGSMEGKKIQAAMDTAVLFSEALRNVRNVSLYTYGYTRSARRTIIYRYQEPGLNIKAGLGSMAARGCTPTSEAIAETVTRLSAKSNEKRLLIVVSDGQPDGSPEDVAKEVKAAEKAGIKVMGISIDDDLPERLLRLMYGNYIKFTDMNSLVVSLGKILKKEVLENTKRKYSA